MSKARAVRTIRRRALLEGSKIMKAELTHLIRDAQGIAHTPREGVDVLREASDSLGRNLIYVRYSNGTTGVVFGDDLERFAG